MTAGMGGQWKPLVAGLLALLLAAVGAAYLSTRPDDSPAPATKEAIAAVAVDVLDIAPSSYEPNPSYDVPEPLGVVIRWHPGDSEDAHYLHLAVEASVPDNTRCHDHPRCAEWVVGGGTMHLSWQEEVPEEDPGIVDLVYSVDGEDRSAVYAGQHIEGDPREQDDLPVSVDDLERLLTDPRFSATTTQEMVDTDLAKWPDDEARAGEPVPTSPAVVAQWFREDGGRTAGAVPADTKAYGGRAVGVDVRSADHATSLVLVPLTAEERPACEAGWHCVTRQGITTGWRPGVAIVLRRSRDVVVLGTVRSAAIVGGPPRPSWRFGGAGSDFAALENGYARYGLTTTRGYADGLRPLRG